jgi:tetratricopeptide (TPR) repeat protein
MRTKAKLNNMYTREIDQNGSRPVARAILCAMLCAATLGLAACSSAPKRPAETFATRNAAIAQIAQGNRAAARGDYANAEKSFDAAWRLAVSADDPESRIRSLLARGNARFAAGEPEAATELWTQALSEATEAQDKRLVALARVSAARGLIADGSAAKLDPTDRLSRAAEAKAVALAEMAALAGDDLATALAWRVVGLAEKEQGNATEAEAALRKALDAHGKANYLEDSAYDWFVIASVRSKAERYDEAAAAIQEAIALNRRAENSGGLGLDWLALGKIREKSGDVKKAAEAYRRAADIFKAAYLETDARDAEARLAALSGASAP